MKKSIFYVSSPNDGYFVGIILAESSDDAISIAWKEYTEQTRPNGEWKEYHTSSSEFSVRDLGDAYFGSDGEGSLEVV